MPGGLIHVAFPMNDDDAFYTEQRMHEPIQLVEVFHTEGHIKMSQPAPAPAAHGGDGHTAV